MESMIDVHCHMQFHAFKKDADEIIKKALDSGVEIIINTGTDLGSSQTAIELAEKYKELYAIVGIHPHHADKLEVGWDEKLIKIAKSSKKVLAIGEIGIDYYSYASNGIVDPRLQKDAFIRQLEIAHELNLPLQIHNRQAGEDILKIVNDNWSIINNGGMFHCMSGNLEFLNNVIDLGFYVGFDGNITYSGIAKGEDTPLSELVKNAPIERILTETDAPFLTPIPFRGSRNEPAHVIIVGEEIAKIKGISYQEVKTKTTSNAKSLFRLSPKP